MDKQDPTSRVAKHNGTQRAKQKQRTEERAAMTMRTVRVPVGCRL